MESIGIYCLDCKRKFKDRKSLIEFHQKPAIQVFENEHKFIEAEDTLKCISELYEGNKKLNNELQKQQKQIQDLSENINLFKNFIQDIFLECNVCVKNGNSLIQNIGKCLLQFFPKSIKLHCFCWTFVGLHMVFCSCGKRKAIYRDLGVSFRTPPAGIARRRDKPDEQEVAK